MLHAHFGGESRDCDGLYTHGADIAAHEGEDTHTFELRMLALAFHYPDAGPVHIEVDRMDDGRLIIHYGMQTDEGYRRGGYTICEEDDFEPAYNGFRDHTAESMGY